MAFFGRTAWDDRIQLANGVPAQRTESYVSGHFGTILLQAIFGKELMQCRARGKRIRGWGWVGAGGGGFFQRKLVCLNICRWEVPILSKPPKTCDPQQANHQTCEFQLPLNLFEHVITTAALHMVVLCLRVLPHIHPTVDFCESQRNMPYFR